MSQASDVIAAARRYLMSSDREMMNRLDGSLGSGDGTLTFEFPAGPIATGALLSVDLELMHVWSVAGQIATVQRGLKGSTPAAHVDQALITVNPMVSDFAIFSEINNELASVSSATLLFRALPASFSATVAGSYDLAADALKILAVQWNDYGPTNDWPVLTRWDLLTGQDQAIFASGVAVRLFEVPPPGRTVRVMYAAPLGRLSNLTEDVEDTTGLPEGATDILAIGAAARILAGREARRSSIDAQPESRQASDVPPGTARSASAQLFALRDRRLKEETAKLSARWSSMRRRAVV